MKEYVIKDKFGVIEQWKDKPLELVRCRDCKYFVTSKNTDHCAFTQKYARVDGFCAWGTKREHETIKVWNEWSKDDVTCSEES